MGFVAHGLRISLLFLQYHSLDINDFAIRKEIFPDTMIKDFKCVGDAKETLGGLLSEAVINYNFCVFSESRGGYRM